MDVAEHVLASKADAQPVVELAARPARVVTTILAALSDAQEGHLEKMRDIARKMGVDEIHGAQPKQRHLEKVRDYCEAQAKFLRQSI